MVQKVISELEFQNSATINPETAKSLGKGLGVEAIVTGTLEDVGHGKVEIGARMIKTETYQIVAASVQKVEKTWQDGEAPVAKAAKSTESTSQESHAAPAEPVFVPSTFQRLRRHITGFFDFYLGTSNSKMDLKFENSRAVIDQNDLSFSGITPNPFRSISFTGLSTKTSTPIGMRFGAFGEIFGGDMEMSIYNHAMKAQNTSYSLNGVNRGGFIFRSDPYLKVTVLNLLTGDLLVRIPTSDRVFPYLGFGMGMTLNTVSSSFVKQGVSSPTTLSETEPGFTFRIPIGVRAKFNDNLGMFGEWRYNYNTFTFNRGISGETDVITMTGSQILLGMCLFF
jgi:opacity protein-like surface antigen